MNNDDPRHDGDDQPDDVTRDAFASVEKAIQAAGSYVIPSDDLRPRTLEAAHELCDARRSGVRLGRFAAVLLLCMVVSVPLAERLTAWYERVSSPSSAELQERALEIAADRNIGPHWGLFEAFSQLRRSQAARLGQAGRPSTFQSVAPLR